MLLNLYNLIVEALTGFAGSSALTGGLGSHYGNMYHWASSVNRGVAQPVAYEVLTLFLIIELAQVAFRTAENSTNGMVGISSLVKLAIKYGICKGVIDHSQMILRALYTLSQRATAGLAGMGGNIHYDWGTSALKTAVEAQVENSTFLECIPAAMVLIITLIIAWVGSQLVKVVITVRFVHLYVLYAFGPIPMATLMADGHWNMAPGYIRSWLAACFHGTILFFILGSFQFIAADMVTNSGTLLGACTSVTGIIIVLIVCLMSAERLSGKIFGA